MPLCENLTRHLRGRRAKTAKGGAPSSATPERQVDVRITANLLDCVRAHVEDLTPGRTGRLPHLLSQSPRPYRRSPRTRVDSGPRARTPQQRLRFGPIVVGAVQLICDRASHRLWRHACTRPLSRRTSADLFQRRPDQRAETTRHGQPPGASRSNRNAASRRRKDRHVRGTRGDEPVHRRGRCGDL